MNWHNRFKLMKLGMKLTNADIAEITGNTPDSIKSGTQPNKELPRWLKLSIYIYEKMSKEQNQLRYSQSKNNFLMSRKINEKDGDNIRMCDLMKGNEFKYENKNYTVRLPFLDWNKSGKPYLFTTCGVKIYNGGLIVTYIKKDDNVLSRKSK